MTIVSHSLFNLDAPPNKMGTWAQEYGQQLNEAVSAGSALAADSSANYTLLQIPAWNQTEVGFEHGSLILQDSIPSTALLGILRQLFSWSCSHFNSLSIWYIKKKCKWTRITFSSDTVVRYLVSGYHRDPGFLCLKILNSLIKKKTTNKNSD